MVKIMRCFSFSYTYPIIPSVQYDSLYCTLKSSLEKISGDKNASYRLFTWANHFHIIACCVLYEMKKIDHRHSTTCIIKSLQESLVVVGLLYDFLLGYLYSLRNNTSDLLKGNIMRNINSTKMLFNKTYHDSNTLR